jgi:hypothetical protein
MKAYLSKEKIIAWYFKNDPSSLLIAKLKEGEIVDRRTSYDTAWIEKYDGKEVFIDKRNELSIMLFENEKNRLGDGYESIVSLEIIQPEPDAWIEWR